jgi:drug/metabolite transporter (DMT)-like permease
MNPLAQRRRTATATALALIGFAANSILCRKALGSDAIGARAIDAWSFTCIRLGSGALVLFALSRANIARRSNERDDRSMSIGRSDRSASIGSRTRGSWLSALALFAYAGAFSLAYMRLAAGVGALVLFACVQATMIGWGIKCGERPSRIEWVGIAVAIGGLVVLTLPGSVAFHPIALGLMMVAGIAWGTYSLRGRASRAPLAATANNFARSVPMAIAGLLFALPSVHLSARGVWLALASGSIASGVGYSLWYAALPHLTAARAAIVQLLVPILAALLGVLVLGESVTVRSSSATLLILGGVALAIFARRRPASAPSRAASTPSAPELVSSAPAIAPSDPESASRGIGARELDAESSA